MPAKNTLDARRHHAHHVVEQAPHHRRRGAGHAAAHRVLAHRHRGLGLQLRAVRHQGRDDRARPARVAGISRLHGAGPARFPGRLPARDPPAGRQPDHHRSLDRRQPDQRRLLRYADLPSRPHRRLRHERLPLARCGRSAAFGRFQGGVRGGLPAADHEAVQGRRAERGSVPHHPPQCAGAGHRGRRSDGAARIQHHHGTPARGVPGGQGPGRCRRLVRAVWERSDLAMRQAIAKIPPGTYRGEVETDGFDQPITLRCAITVKSDEIHVDCEGSSPQQEHGINCTKRWSFAEVAHACTCVAHPASPVNGATLKRITYSVPEGTVINATYPAALGARALVAMYLQGMIFRTLGAGGPRSRHRRDRDAAASVGLHGPRQWRAALRRHHVPERRARRQADHGWRVVDRLAGQHRGHPGGGDREREAPAVPRQGARHRFRRRRAGSAAASRRVWRCDRRRASRSRSACASTASRIPHSGFSAASPAARRAVSVNGKPVHSKKTLALAAGDVYAARCAGGAGYGDPHERPPEAVLRDVKGGYVSAAVARNDYGVALTDAGDAVDAEGTRRLRKRR